MQTIKRCARAREHWTSPPPFFFSFFRPKVDYNHLVHEVLTPSHSMSGWHARVRRDRYSTWCTCKRCELVIPRPRNVLAASLKVKGWWSHPLPTSVWACTPYGGIGATMQVIMIIIIIMKSIFKAKCLNLLLGEHVALFKPSTKFDKPAMKNTAKIFKNLLTQAWRLSNKRKNTNRFASIDTRITYSIH